MNNNPCNFSDDFVNVSAYLQYRAETNPYKLAIAYPESRDSMGRMSWTRLNNRQLNELSNRYANGLTKAGIKRGERTLLMVRPSLDFIALAFSLFKIGAIPVLIDPGMGLTRLLECVKTVSPQSMVAVPEAIALMKIVKKSFSSVKSVVTVGKPWFFKGEDTRVFADTESPIFEIARTRPDEQAAILFTTGSTGPAKGVVYEHSMFEAQVRQLIDHYKITEDEIEMPAFPLFALFSPALGISCIIPEMDPTKPAEVDPAKIVEAIESFGVTNTFGSPSIWRKVSSYCISNKIKLPTLKRILMAGAPAPLEVLGKFREILPNGETHTPYGATESLPSFDVTGTEILLPEHIKNNVEGGGTLVGKPLPGMEARVIKIIDEPIKNYDESLELGNNEIGEILITGPVTTKEYFNREKDTKKAKIKDGDRIWHRMGDVGYRDKNGYFWFCGRKTHRVETESGTMFTIKCEAIFNNHAKVFRSALVGIGEKGKKKPVIIIEPFKNNFPKTVAAKKEFIKELLEIARENKNTDMITDIRFYETLPTDIRHNAKIFREKLAVWAETGKIDEDHNLKGSVKKFIFNAFKRGED